MNNRAVLAFIHKLDKKVKYGKWSYYDNKLFFNYVMIAENNSEVVVYEQSLIDCGFEYNTLNAINRIINFLK